ncbi:MAG: type III secretion system export apparatus subunit SctV [Dongiaceae bacterium]
MDSLQRLLVQVTRRNDIMLAVLVVAVIFMMILPLPTELVDALIATNMAVSAILLMVAIYLPSPLAFSAFPSVLLLTTLFRLALAISTTRLILLQADAGQIIFTFGNFVVGGNLIVGLVVFLIITIVQFVVITKGAERVAEVGARFSLDAMPGKQMSIDADMRAGAIDMVEARRRRGLVEKESQLYGSMDGAMKFVKGDAIAGIIVVAVNMLGGIIIGTLQRGMPAGKAVQTYSVLTVGDGLIQQIPALFIAITAGIIVTRVTSDEASNLGTDIGAQVMAQPKALLIGSAIMLGFAAIPGFPTTIFIALAIVIGGIGFLLTRMARAAADGKPGAGTLPAMMAAGRPPAAKQPASAEEDFALTVPLLMDVAADVQQRVPPDALNEELIKVRRALYFDLGVPFPGIHLRFNERLPAATYAIQLNEIPVSSGTLKPGHLLVRETPENLDALKVPHLPDRKFLPNMETIWVAESQRELLAKAGIPLMEPTQILVYHLSFVLKKYAADFVGIQETRFLLGNMEGRFPDLVKEVQRIMPLQKITEILQRLVSEEVSIRNLRLVLEALIEWGQKEKDSVLLAEYVRTALRRYISYKHSSGQNILPAYLFAQSVEDSIRGAIRQTSAGSYLALDPAVSRKLIETIKRTVGDIAAQAQRPVLVTSMDIRRYVRKLIELDLYELPILSYQELTQEITIQPLGRIELA